MTRPHLPPDESAALWAVILDAVRQRRELTNKALARRFGVSYGTICKRVARARRKGLVP